MNLAFLQSCQIFNGIPDIVTQSSSQISPSYYVYVKRLYTILPHFNDKGPIFQLPIILYSCYN